jgi:hypothetical protein
MRPVLGCRHCLTRGATARTSCRFQRVRNSSLEEFSRSSSSTRSGRPTFRALTVFLCFDAAQHISGTLLPVRPVTG